jgi:DNA-3-methyladenine glycosylase
MQPPLDRAFYERPPLVVAKDLIGKEIVRTLPASRARLTGRIVEVEAYGGSSDPASHAYRGLTRRNAAMFGEAGHAYVYFTYGAHYCLNFVTTKLGRVGAVLIRAVEPVQGVEFMARSRRTDDIYSLASGPGKLCQAFSIDLSLNTVDLTCPSSPIAVFSPGNSAKTEKVSRSGRIGIATAVSKHWRFFVKGSPFVSRKPKS